MSKGARRDIDFQIILKTPARTWAEVIINCGYSANLSKEDMSKVKGCTQAIVCSVYGLVLRCIEAKNAGLISKPQMCIQATEQRLWDIAAEYEKLTKEDL